MCAVILIVFAVATTVPPARSTERPYAEEWIFEVVIPPSWVITPGTIAYQFEGRYYLPVIELAEAFEFFIEAEIGRAYFSGFASQEENSFTVDGERGEFVFGGKKEILSPDVLLSSDIIGEDDIYVQIEFLNKIWPVNMQVDLSNLVIVTEPEEELSFERQLKREEQREKLADAKEQRVEPKRLPYVHNPYHFLSQPVVDLQSSYTYDTLTKTLNGANSISGALQLAKMNADFAASYAYRDGKIRAPNSIRFKLERKAVGDESFLGTGVKSFQAGDVNLRQRDLVRGGIGGRGFIFSNDPLRKAREFDRITVEGTGPQGWEIELYNNNSLLEFGVVDEEGEYRFEDVILNAGNNRIRAVMYGPQGQVREEVQNFNINQKMLSPGEFVYNTGFVDVARPLFLLDDSPSNTVGGVAKTFSSSYGVNRDFTVFGSVSQLPVQEEQRTYTTAGLSFGTLLGVGEVEAYREAGGGHAVDARFITQVLGVSLNFRSAFFRGFESDTVGFGTAAKVFQGEVQASKSFRLPVGSLGLRLNLKHRELKSGVVTTDVNTSESFTRGGIRVSNNTTSTFIDELHERSAGNITTTTRMGPLQFRGSFGYTIHPLSQLVSGQGEVRYKASNDLQAALSLQHGFVSRLSGVSMQLGYDFNKFLGTADASYQEGTGWTFVMRATSALNPYTPDDSYSLTSKSKRGTSPVLGRVFWDKDLDGQYSEGDEPLPDVKLRIEGGRSREVTDENGLIVADAPSLQMVNLRIDEASLDDPYFLPSVEGYSTIPIQGALPRFDFPVIETGAIDGTVYYDDGSPLPGMKLELVDHAGEVIKTVETAYDGFYTFEFIPPGTYTVRADPSYQVNVPPETVTVASDDLFSYGIDLALLEQAEEEQAADESVAESGGVAHTYHAPAAKGTMKSAPTTTDGGLAAFVKRVRIGEHPNKVRLVLELSGAVQYNLTSSEDGTVVLVDLPHVAWDAIQHWRATSTPVLQSFSTEALAGGGARLTLKARHSMSVGLNGVLGPKSGRGHRLYIDLHKSK